LAERQQEKCDTLAACRTLSIAADVFKPFWLGFPQSKLTSR
jgi:hypothetical protein